MNSEARRRAILQALERAEKPLPAATLAGELAVSRQIIVGDVALLRAGGARIVATSRGYVLGGRSGERRTVACCHRAQDMERELELMVDYGCTVEDVTVEHPVYGQLTGRLDLSSRYDVREFVEKVAAEKAKSLSELTGGIHLHNLRCPDEKAFEQLLDALRKEGFLLE